MEKTIDLLAGELGLPVCQKYPDELVVEVTRVELAVAAQVLRDKFAASLVLMTGSDFRSVWGDFRLTYVFALPERVFVLLQVSIDPADTCFPSLTPQVPAAHWYEREVQDLLGLVPVGHPDPRRLVLHRNWPEGAFPLRKDFDLSQMPTPGAEEFEMHPVKGEGVFEIPVGPIHAGIIEPGHFRFSSVGESILNLEANLFYTHKGTEKLCEGKTFEQVLLIAERVCGVCAVSHAISFCQAVEKLAGCEIPKRAAYIRTLALELERLYNHVGDMGNICAGTGFSVGSSQGARLKEKLLSLNEQVFGHRYLRGINRLGGVNKDLERDDCQLLLKSLAEIKQEFIAVSDLLLNQDSLMDRFSGTGRLSPETVKDLGVVGPAARAAGVDCDTRRDHPHLAYSQMQFEVVVGKAGDVMDRFKVRIGEALESFKIVAQLLKAMPEGEIKTDVGEIMPYQSGLGYVESPRGQVIHYLVSGPGNTVYRYMIRSASYTNWPAVPLAVQGNIVPDFPLINKSFELCYSCLDR